MKPEDQESQGAALGADWKHDWNCYRSGGTWRCTPKCLADRADEAQRVEDERNRRAAAAAGLEALRAECAEARTTIENSMSWGAFTGQTFDLARALLALADGFEARLVLLETGAKR